MGDHSNIEWCDATWNPIVGCSIVSPGCTHCYAMLMAHRIQAMAADRSSGQAGHYLGTTKKVNGNAVWTGKVARAPEHVLLAPMKWKKPRRIFVNSMGDLFHESIPDEWIDQVFAVMALCPQHTFQVLTKRAERMREYVTSLHNSRALAPIVSELVRECELGPREMTLARTLPNVWLGVSAERQQEADERIPLLLQTPAAIRFVSAEPLLGPIDLGKYLNGHEDNGIGHTVGACIGWTPPLDWVIVGGESGPHARPMHPAWARSLRDQCEVSGVPFFYKQAGEWRQRDCVHVSRDHAIFNPDGSCQVGVGAGTAVSALRTHVVMERMGKKAAGRLLDGREHNGFPEVCA